MIRLVSFSPEPVDNAETFIIVQNFKITFAHFWKFRENNQSSSRVSFPLFIIPFSNSGSLSCSSVSESRLGLSLPCSLIHLSPLLNANLDKWAQMARLYLNGGHQKCLMHYNEKRHLCSHKAFSVPAQ